MNNIYATHGYTGSGKTTYAKRFCKQNRIVRLSHDELMITLYGTNPDAASFPTYFDNVTRLMTQIAADMLKQNFDIFLDLALFKRKDRDFWRDFAKSNGANFHLFHIKCSQETALRRTLQRTKTKKEDAMIIDENAFKVINARLEPLAEDEPHITIDTDSSF